VYPNLGISIALQAPGPAIPSANQVYVNPIGILNAASFAPFTSGISPGELIAIYGSNLALAGSTQVTINGTPAQFVGVPSPTQVSVLVPFNILGPYAQLQVTNGQASNIVWELVDQTSPGIFTQAQNGLGDAVVLHSNGNAVTSSSKAVPGETVYIVATGLGAGVVQPGIGVPGSPSSTPIPPSSITVTIAGIVAAVNSVTLSPGNQGMYEIAATVPPAAAAGDLSLVVAEVDGTTALATIPVGAAPASSTATSAAVRARAFIR
jgi:uncharacterized protein (TIGR03437 family)